MIKEIITQLDYGALYSVMHERKDEKFFPGRAHKANKLFDLIRARQPQRLLDYGSGKGYQYLVGRWHERWGGPLPYCYDIGVRQLSERPTFNFDGVLCCDMLEHIAPYDVNAILDDLAGFVRPGGFLYLLIDTLPTAHKGRRKAMPDGTDIHLTVEAPEWWRGKLKRIADRDLTLAVDYVTASSSESDAAAVPTLPSP